MRMVKLNQREARLLRGNLTENQEGYDYQDLCRLDFLAKQLTALQGDYGDDLAKLTRAERAIRRAFAKDEVTEAETNKQLQAIRFEAEDLNEAAELVSVEFRIAERDHAIISDKLASVEKWQANDEIRHVVLGMITAVTDAAYCEDAPDEEGNGHEAQPLKGLIHLSKDRARRR